MFPIGIKKSVGNRALKHAGNIRFPIGVEKHTEKYMFRVGITYEIPTKHKTFKIIISQIKILSQAIINMLQHNVALPNAMHCHVKIIKCNNETEFFIL